jgi:hypothetical protein
MKKSRNLQTFDFSRRASATLNRLKRKTRLTKKDILERLVFAAESNPDFLKL